MVFRRRYFPILRLPRVGLRTAALFHYFMACPAAEVDGHLLERGHTPAGYFLLSRIGGQCRIADLWIRSQTAGVGRGLRRRDVYDAPTPRSLRLPLRFPRLAAALSNRRATAARIRELVYASTRSAGWGTTRRGLLG